MIKRQAVIIIHGIGEQNPMDTLREFVVSIVPKIENSSKPKFYNKPDHLSSLFELRRITTNAHKHTFKTDYFEYYWAHTMRSTKRQDVWWWFIKIMLRRPKHIPNRLKWLYVLFWILLFIAGVLLTSVIISTPNFKLEELLPSDITRVILSVFLFIINYFIIWYLGDASRYMTPSPNNIAERQTIRKNGLDLLRSLHNKRENGKNKYDRIMIVGHSLGSVIAYDLINLYWSLINDRAGKISAADIDFIEQQAQLLNNKEISIEQFQGAQFDVWKRQYSHLGSWRISDFITLGSPLAYSKLFLAKKPQVFMNKIEEREIATCPPMPEVDGKFSYNHKTKGTILHHASAFAFTRWTNIYFQKDFIGGEIDDLGLGISNIQLEPTKLTWKIFPFRKYIPFISHTCYWDNDEESSITSIRSNLELFFSNNINANKQKVFSDGID